MQPLSDLSKLTDRYQTTVPSAVRKQLNLRKGDHLRYNIDASGRVWLEAAGQDASDPALAGFLSLLERDIATHPAKLRAIDKGLRARLDGLARDVDTDLDAALSPDDE
jgi:antitoxin PrlF